ncbi:hypothetical protein QAD02_005486 [Eretmocerus hayati]|uniref:Uncharacterized protein n=1 Tax=Eretmocerus hayati TaxID=131215 RepID=A0ACC2NV94_9HYME|nr:hypothetical protein QAD02_005486 [Eretmocerus hayati]
MYLRPGVYHQVITLTPNWAEASNFGDSEWQVMSGKEAQCGCGKMDVVSILPNPNACVRLSSTPVRKHWCVDCGFRSNTKKELIRHAKDVLKKNIEEPRLRTPAYCPDCKIFVVRLSNHRSQSASHKANVAARLAQNVVAVPDPIPVLVCRVCNIICSDEKALESMKQPAMVNCLDPRLTGPRHPWSEDRGACNWRNRQKYRNKKVWRIR